MAAQEAPSGSAGRSMGIVIFTVGIALMAVVFVLAILTFQQLPQLLASDQPPPQGILAVLAIAAARAVFLLVMGYVSSLMASKGLDLYAASRASR
jgi:flagellar basal body-associated protein FliL